jgi:tetratricopeptide (TPR) repeat protein
MTRPPAAVAPPPTKLTANIAGDSGSAAALQRLSGHLKDARTRAMEPLLRQALGALRASRRKEAAATAAKILGLDPDCGLAWHIQAICQEKSGDYTAALASYEEALARMPEEPEIANDLGRLALKMGMADIAEALFSNYLTRRPDSVEGLNNLACAQRDQMRFVEAIETLREGIGAHPDKPLLWNALGSVLTLQGQVEQAVVFYDEALRLDPDFAIAIYNRAGAYLALERFDEAIEDLDRCIAIAGPGPEAVSMRMERARVLLAAGRLAEGWEDYKARLDPLYEDLTLFVCDRPEWTPQMDIAGRRLLLMGEQGLGDQVLFANLVPKVLEEIGPAGELILAVEPRLVPIFSRSFPGVTVGPAAAGKVDHRKVCAAPHFDDRLAQVDAWAPLAAPLLRWGQQPSELERAPFLKPDPDRLGHWRAALAQRPGLKVGVMWKSMIMDAERSRHFAPFGDWEPVFAVPGVTFVNLQYGDYEAEAAALRDGLGVELWGLPDFDPKDGLEDVAALTCALDVVIGPATATTNLAGACGAETWLISFPGAWPTLGTGGYPWYPRMKVFKPATFGVWRPLMETIAAELAILA